MRTLRYALGVALVLLVPATAAAQIPIFDKITGSLESFAGFWIYSGFLPNSPTLAAGKVNEGNKQHGVQGPGVGILFDLGHVVHVDTMRNPHRVDTAWAFHGGLAYSRMTGFRAQDPTFELRGSLQELPRFSFFAQPHPTASITPYFGLHFGFVQLKSVSIYDSLGTIYPIAGDTYELGAFVGLSARLKAGTQGFTLFVEPGYSLRNVVNLEYSGTKVLPARFPRGLRFTGWEIAMGLAIAVPVKETAAPPRQ